MKIKSVIVFLAFSSLLSGCVSRLDMRNQDVTERIEMHAGSSWRTSMQLPAPGNPVVAYPTLLATNGMSEDEAKRWRTELASFESTAKNDFEEQEVFLRPDKFQTRGGPPIELHVVNQSLWCEPRSRIGEAGYCKPFVDLSGAITSPSETLTWCVNEWRERYKKFNLVGVFRDKYCLLITVVEQKECGSKCTDKNQNRPTNINRDSLHILFLFPGPGGAGAVVGGPYPQFRATPMGGTRLGPSPD
jgi:hypothetical protein